MLTDDEIRKVAAAAARDEVRRILGKEPKPSEGDREMQHGEEFIYSRGQWRRATSLK